MQRATRDILCVIPAELVVESTVGALETSVAVEQRMCIWIALSSVLNTNGFQIELVELGF